MKKTENKKNTAADPVSQDYLLVNNAETLEKLINKVKKAQEILSTFSQEKIDHIFRVSCSYFICGRAIQTYPDFSVRHHFVTNVGVLVGSAHDHRRQQLPVKTDGTGIKGLIS